MRGMKELKGAPSEIQAMLQRGSEHSTEVQNAPLPVPLIARRPRPDEVRVHASKSASSNNWSSNLTTAINQFQEGGG